MMKTEWGTLIQGIQGAIWQLLWVVHRICFDFWSGDFYSKPYDFHFKSYDFNFKSYDSILGQIFLLVSPTKFWPLGPKTNLVLASLTKFWPLGPIFWGEPSYQILALMPKRRAFWGYDQILTEFRLNFETASPYCRICTCILLDKSSH